MIIDSKEYSSDCLCGKKHTMTTELCVIEKGCLEKFSEYTSKYGLTGRFAAVYDENTYEAAGAFRPLADYEIILSPKNLHADEHGVELVLSRLPKDTEFLVAIGSGTIHDITRYSAYKREIPFVSCPTAASVDGFCSSVAAMTWHGHKKTLVAVAPKIVLADLGIIAKAPIRLARSGFGDMIGKFIALTDWKIATLLVGEHFCQSIYDMTLDAARAVMESAKGIKNGDISAYERLTFGLLMSGIAMQLLGSSRCASGAEHHISHFIEVQPKIGGIHSNALHGEKVGVGTVLALREYRRLAGATHEWKDYSKASDKLITEIFGERLAPAVISENEGDSCEGIGAKLLTDKWEKICEIVKENLPNEDELLESYSVLGIKSTLSDIGVDEGLLNAILDYSPLVRNRLTLMRLRRTLKM